MKLFWITLLVTGTALAAPTASDRVIHVDQDIDYVIPARSPVRFESFGKFGAVAYSGQFFLAGHYTYGFVPDNPEEGVHDQLELLFTISESDAGKLPYWSRDRPIREIYIRNPDRFARQVIGNHGLALLHSKKVRRFSGVAIIKVRHLETTIECDHQGTSVEFVSGHDMTNREVAATAVDTPGC